jgi:hypothetical protein
MRSAAWCLGRTCLGGRAGIVEATPVVRGRTRGPNRRGSTTLAPHRARQAQPHRAKLARLDQTTVAPLREAVCNSTLPSSATRSTFAHAWGLDTKASALFQAGGLVTRASLPGDRSDAPCGPLAVPPAGNGREQATVSPSVFAGFPRVPGCSRTTNISGRQASIGFLERSLAGPQPFYNTASHRMHASRLVMYARCTFYPQRRRKPR